MAPVLVGDVLANASAHLDAAEAWDNLVAQPTAADEALVRRWSRARSATPAGGSTRQTRGRARLGELRVDAAMTETTTARLRRIRVGGGRAP